ncbi:non-specific serine/threonine protein kinase [Salvia divinorum]|uniref:Non-specific serine/threonine protein kinase n=1 Tax=Salvia divinorum TaxID=28513 RepID=A0ABD1HJD3_SALDI
MNRSKNFFENLLKPFTSGSNRDQDEDDLGRIAAREQKNLPFEALAVATKNFHPSHKLGEGGFGSVYHGKLSDGREVAVKRLSQRSSQGNKEFLTEAKLLSRVQHKNVVSLLGYSIRDAEKLLVYEYVANQSLDKYLFKPGKKELLDWNRRHDVILVPMVTLHPSVFCKALSLKKADVFSFGVVVLELISGQKNSSFTQEPDSESLLEWAYKLYRKQRSFEIMDPVLVSSADIEQLPTIVQIGLLCVQSDPQARPDMDRVVMLLSRKLRHLEEPSRPGVPGSRFRRYRTGTTSSATGNSYGSNSGSFGSTNLLSISSSATSSSLANTRLQRHGKHPIKD